SFTLDFKTAKAPFSVESPRVDRFRNGHELRRVFPVITGDGDLACQRRTQCCAPTECVRVLRPIHSTRLEFHLYFDFLLASLRRTCLSDLFKIEVQCGSAHNVCLVVQLCASPQIE